MRCPPPSSNHPRFAVEPGSERVAARAPDPDGGAPYGLLEWRTADGQTCTYAGAGRPHLGALDPRWNRFAPVPGQERAEPARPPRRRARSRCTSAAPARPAIPIRSAPHPPHAAGPYDLSGTAHPDVREITIETPARRPHAPTGRAGPRVPRRLRRRVLRPLDHRHGALHRRHGAPHHDADPLTTLTNVALAAPDRLSRTALLSPPSRRPTTRRLPDLLAGDAQLDRAPAPLAAWRRTHRTLTRAARPLTVAETAASLRAHGRLAAAPPWLADRREQQAAVRAPSTLLLAVGHEALEPLGAHAEAAPGPVALEHADAVLAEKNTGAARAHRCGNGVGESRAYGTARRHPLSSELPTVTRARRSDPDPQPPTNVAFNRVR